MLNVTQTTLAFLLLLQLTSILLPIVFLIIVLHIYEIDCVLQNNGLLIGIVIFNAIENPITFCKATEYSWLDFCVPLTQTLPPSGRVWQWLIQCPSDTVLGSTLVLFQQELRGTAYDSILCFMLRSVIHQIIFESKSWWWNICLLNGPDSSSLVWFSS